MIAGIALDGLVYAIDKPYSYTLPEALSAARPGCRVSVPFGAGNRLREGMILTLTPGEDPALKAVVQVLDAEPVLSESMLRLAAFVRERYFCSFYEAIRAMLPAGLWLQSREVFALAKLPEDWEARLEDEPLPRRLVELLRDAGGRLRDDALYRQCGAGPEIAEALRRLRERGWLRADTELCRKNSDKTELILELTADPEQIEEHLRARGKSAPMQRAVMELLSTVGVISQKELQYFTGASLPTLRSLERAGLLRISAREVLRRTQIAPYEGDLSFALSPEQQSVFEGLLAQMRAPRPGAALLYGVTGSGKTAIYVNLIRRCLAEGRTALLLVPEIALTPQLLSLFSACFGRDVAVLHSALRVGERYDEYKRIARGEARVAVGTRSAVFAPLQGLGLIVVDEEQEHSYKSENSPRYHAREVALCRGSREGALVVLGSATPSVESMYRARRGDYALYRLPNRFNGRALPAVELVDMKQELLRGNSTAVSGPLLEAIRERMIRKEKSILLLNRRGSNRLVICVDCGFVPACPRCSVNLTYHMANERLMCHYCGHSQPVYDKCPACGGHLKRVGIGTQQLEYDLGKLLPEARLLRMDADTISPTNPHEAVLSRFAKEDISVLIGTQMVAKGLNFPEVTLVGVVDADASLYVDSYRAAETSFSLITQVVGRSGRGDKPGTAIIQTLTPQNAVLRQAAAQDYDSFYETELPLRRLRNCPPYCDQICVGFSGFPERHVEDCAARFARVLWQRLEQTGLRGAVTDLLGPAPAPVAKINNKYRFRLTLLCANSKPLRLELSSLVRSFSKEKENRGVALYVDVNGYE
ncbi:MAG: primosomal protein N' [Oscillospiraceae bacterium]|nr:primosomal protein N' [Oscillospiraceae bacterium]